MLVGMLLIIGAVVAAVGLIVPVVMGLEPHPQFEIPGRTEVKVEDAGRYYIWNDYSAVFEGVTYNQSADLPGGITIEITDLHSGEALPLREGPNQSMSVGDTSRKSIGYVDVPEATTLLVDVPQSPEKRVFSFGKSEVFKLIGAIFGAIGAALVLGFVGIGLMIWGIIAFASGKR